MDEISWAQLDARFPNVIGTNLESRHFVDSSAFPLGCLIQQRPELAQDLGYFETRINANGVKVYLFDSAAVTDTLVGFSTGTQSQVLVVGML